MGFRSRCTEERLVSLSFSDAAPMSLAMHACLTMSCLRCLLRLCFHYPFHASYPDAERDFFSSVLLSSPLLSPPEYESEIPLLLLLSSLATPTSTSPLVRRPCLSLSCAAPSISAPDQGQGGSVRESEREYGAIPGGGRQQRVARHASSSPMLCLMPLLLSSCQACCCC